MQNTLTRAEKSLKVSFKVGIVPRVHDLGVIQVGEGGGEHL